MTALKSFGNGYRALVIGASGALGQAFCDALEADPGCALVTRLSRNSAPPLDLEDAASIPRAAEAVAQHAPYHLIIVSSGLLHRPGIRPEKSLSALDADALQAVFQVNTLGPALLLRDFLPLLDPQGAMALLSAKVGSIGDNRLGGWYAYRASKAALNMLIKTASIELARRAPRARLLSLHPGTVQSALSQPFRGAAAARPAAQAARELLAVIDNGTPADSGGFFTYNGERIEW
ncbi:MULTISPECIES: SDR family NAD(P)-dependent oxidoreductase [Halopseudomonas]|jgi:NAD(P)-dependent dehydrogenase (short-subunit alcohol dehydrogenase family)|uniref:SDR family NAD(P)-dependent oxidoreductase n=1 Tax=Halopseudomonas TaxID=2901189 RepID=UPI001D17FDCE|nr:MULTISPECIES: SDR family NAD(P)-dependent oxidoreductase [Halopseudomonas]MCC4259047.1 SDR family NAD(P)-dependent oxidoreductase [Halopseudomonas aestusnigri]MEE2799887.1 SDR family NAD(P)-dependent oxidoreductase [Pseudomonadota bacterium]BDX19887.1 SDR family oxidoreductase [Halopseudomonas aestusnigri]GMQ54191.1 SDR family NAD(P)-dependent oxidoreductase [Halopseudomonas aestusnigri]